MAGRVGRRQAVMGSKRGARVAVAMGLTVALAGCGSEARPMTVGANSPPASTTRIPAQTPAAQTPLMVYAGPGIELVGTVSPQGPPHLYRSTDGVHWSDVTPLAAEQEGYTSYQTFEQATFITSQDGYVSALDQPDSRAYLYETTDGGETWATVPFGGGFHGIDSVQLVTNTFAVESTRCNGIPCAPVQTSTDGFRTLHAPLTFGAPYGPEPPPTATPLPPVTFVTPDEGFTASLIGDLSSNDGWTPKTLFASTHNGGQTWQQVDPPTASTPSVFYGLPTFADANHGVVPTLSGPAGSRVLSFDASTDGGRTWHVQSTMPTTIDPDTTDQAVIDLATTSNWWVASPGPGGQTTFQTTTDGGAHWTTATPATFPRQAGLFDADHLAVVDATTALALVQASAASPLELLRTTDAGRTWQRVTLPGPNRRSGVASTG